MPRRKVRNASSFKQCPSRQTPSGTAGLGNKQTSLDKWLSSSSAAQLPSSLVEAQEIIQDAQEKEEKEQNAAIIAAIEGIYTFPPWDGQREALHHLVFLRKDMILIAKTSFGKSMLLQAVSLLLENAIALIVLPLNQIGIEQTEYIRNLGGRPCFLNADTISAELLEEVKAAKYTHLLLSPELAIGNKFRAVACHPQFRERLRLVAVDEAHLVAHWGRAFRTEYARMQQLRALLGKNVPWFACSATLDQATLETVKQGCGFLPDVKVQRTSINRPELVLRLGKIPKNKRRAFTALRFLFKEGEVVGPVRETAHLNIPKTVVFFDTKNEIYWALGKCREWLEKSDKHRYTPRQIQCTIRVFHRTTAQHDKEATIAEFRQLAMESSVRIIFATEALGIGVNIPDIRRVVQYGIPRGYHPAVPWQRGGRGSRDGQDGEIILLVDEWAFGPRDEAAAQKYARQSKGQGLRQETFAKDVAEEPNEDPAKETLEQEQRANGFSDKERRERLPAFWYNIINARLCLRKPFLDFFEEPKDGDNPTRKERCCSHCNPDFAMEDFDQYYLYQEIGPSYNKKRKLIAEDLEKWAWSKCHDFRRKDKSMPNPSCILTKNQRVVLAQYAHQILTKEDLLGRLGSWDWYDQFGQSLYEELRKAYYTRESSPQTPAEQLGQYIKLIFPYFWYRYAYHAILTGRIQTTAKRKHVLDAPGQFSECSSLTWSSAPTPDSIRQPTPSDNIPVSPWVDIHMPSQDYIDMPHPSETPVPKRRALSEVSGNARPRRCPKGVIKKR
jgi:superfamily II DNA helicase RecQ